MTFWDQGRWDHNEWGGQPPEPGGWDDDWAWWYQTGAGITFPLNEKLVEARWTTDSYTMGDGTFRGDLQPGSITAQFFDPTHSLDNLDHLGAVWAKYKPTGAVWCWFYDTFTRGLVAPGDPAGAFCVFTGTPWPSRLTADRAETGFAAQTIAGRLSYIVAQMSNKISGFPHITANIAAQSQWVAAVKSTTSSDSGPVYPGYLAAVRDAATDGVAWLTGTASGDTGPGALVLNYARWDVTPPPRVLDRSQIVAGPANSDSTAFIINWVRWSGVYTSPSTGATTPSTLDQSYSDISADTSYQLYGVARIGMRFYGDLNNVGDDYAGVVDTGATIINDHAAYEPTLATISLQSGPRWTATGKPATAQWDPYAHTFAPNEIARIDIGGGTIRDFRVQKSDHRLTATAWETTHYLEKFSEADYIS